MQSNVSPTSLPSRTPKCQPSSASEFLYAQKAKDDLSLAVKRLVRQPYPFS
jgi:hypothetical protein